MMPWIEWEILEMTLFIQSQGSKLTIKVQPAAFINIHQHNHEFTSITFNSKKKSKLYINDQYSDYTYKMYQLRHLASTSSLFVTWVLRHKPNIISMREFYTSYGMESRYKIAGESFFLNEFPISFVLILMNYMKD